MSYELAYRARREAGTSRCIALAVATLLAASTLSGCRLHGKPRSDAVPTRPDQVTNFALLYKQNCAACHGERGQDGTAVSLASPAYVAYAGTDHIAQVTAHGVNGSLMPAFAESDGGMLTDQQITILASGILAWGKPVTPVGAESPPYESHATGDAAHGEALYRAGCLHCHAPGKGSVLDPTYLALISDGGLRTLLVAGKPQAGMPDWRGYPGGGLNDQQLADLVTFIAAHRTATPGQPFPDTAGEISAPVSSLTSTSEQKAANP